MVRFFIPLSVIPAAMLFQMSELPIIFFLDQEAWEEARGKWCLDPIIILILLAC